MLKVLVIDDKLDEGQKAAEIIRTLGLQEGLLIYPLVIRLDSKFNRSIEDFTCFLGDLDRDEIAGVLTDLYYVPVTNTHMVKNYGDSIPAGGLLAAIECIHRNIPVVICTDAGEGGGHGGLSSSWIIDGLIRQKNCRHVGGTECNDYFGLNADKNWEDAARALITMIKERRET